METSFANGGQLSASNAEVWTHGSTLLKGLKWMFRSDRSEPSGIGWSTDYPFGEINLLTRISEFTNRSRSSSLR